MVSQQVKSKKAFHFGSDKVSRTIKSYKLNKVVPKSPMRGPTKLTAEVLAYIHTMLYADAHSTLELIKSSVEQRFNIAIALSTVSRGCKQLNYKYKPPKRKQKLTAKQIADRVSFAYTLITMYYSNEIDLYSIVFSDESRFILGDDKRWVWRRHGEENQTAYKSFEKFSKSLMIFGAIGVDFKSNLIFVEGTIDSKKYKQNIIDSAIIETLDEEKGRGNWIFMQDGACCHTSSDTLNWLKTKCRIITKWPANSPDLNPIENLWGCMKKAVSLIKPSSLDELHDVIQQVWDNFPMSSINNLVMSFLQRLQFTINQKGQSIQNHLRKGIAELNFPVNINEKEVVYISDVISSISDEKTMISEFLSDKQFTP